MSISELSSAPLYSPVSRSDFLIIAGLAGSLQPATPEYFHRRNIFQNIFNVEFNTLNFSDLYSSKNVLTVIDTVCVLVSLTCLSTQLHPPGCSFPSDFFTRGFLHQRCLSNSSWI